MFIILIRIEKDKTHVFSDHLLIELALLIDKRTGSGLYVNLDTASTLLPSGKCTVTFTSRGFCIGGIIQVNTPSTKLQRY